MRRISAYVFAVLLCLSGAPFLTAAAWAQSDLRTEGDAAAARGVYQAEVPVNGQAEPERQGAFARALGGVLSKLSGDRNAAGRPADFRVRMMRTPREGSHHANPRTRRAGEGT